MLLSMMGVRVPESRRVLLGNKMASGVGLSPVPASSARTQTVTGISGHSSRFI